MGPLLLPQVIVWMMENSIYSILSPEGFASILWKDSTRAKEAAEVMKLTAVDLKDLGIIEQVIPRESASYQRKYGRYHGRVEKQNRRIPGNLSVA